MTRGLSVIAAVCLGSIARLWSYAAFDDIQLPAPLWLTPPGEPDSPWIYRIARSGLDEVAVDVRNRGTAPMSARLRLAGYQREDAPPLSVELAAGGQARFPVAVGRIDVGVFTAQLAPAGSAAQRRPHVAEETAYALVPLQRSAGFGTHAVAYALRVVDERTLDIHFRNATAHDIHFDFRIHGWQAPDAVNPRVHLLPAGRIECLVRVDRAEPIATHAIVDAFRIRIGADSGPLIAPEPAAFADYPAADGWNPTISAEPSAPFDPAAVLWRRGGDGRLVLRNRSPQAVALRIREPALELTLPPGAEAATPAPAPDVAYIPVHAVAIDGRGMPMAGAAAAPAVPIGAFPVVPTVDDARFNPLALVVAVARGGDQAALTFINLSAVDIHCDCLLARYQPAGTRNPRVRVPAGGRASVRLPVTRVDALLVQTRVQVSNVRLGLDEGPMLVARP